MKSGLLARTLAEKSYAICVNLREASRGPHPNRGFAQFALALSFLRYRRSICRIQAIEQLAVPAVV